MMPALSSTLNFSTSAIDWDYSSNFSEAVFTSAYPTPTITGNNNTLNFTTFSGDETITVNGTNVTASSPYDNDANSSWALLNVSTSFNETINNVVYNDTN